MCPECTCLGETLIHLSIKVNCQSASFSILPKEYIAVSFFLLMALLAQTFILLYFEKAPWVKQAIWHPYN
jgi:hypothetical protein